MVWPKIWQNELKTLPNNECTLFFLPNWKKSSPNGEILPNLVTLLILNDPNEISLYERPSFISREPRRRLISAVENESKGGKRNRKTEDEKCWSLLYKLFQGLLRFVAQKRGEKSLCRQKCFSLFKVRPVGAQIARPWTFSLLNQMRQNRFRWIMEAKMGAA